MPAVQVSNVSKFFGSLRAVDDVSFTVDKGAIFGLLGPNGAGKTTLIRLILDILKPDAGQINVLGGLINEAKKDRIGYMPEERGLYQDITLERGLIYLASLKGISHAEARARTIDYLERFDLADYRKKKVKELSKGMQQKAQVIATILHQPELIIIDEPFISLDPLNTKMIKTMLLELHNQGTTIIMSTHQLNQVEELCDRIMLMNFGQVILYGGLTEIRQEFSGHAVWVRIVGEPGTIPGVISTETHNSVLRLELAQGVSPQEVLKHLVKQNVKLEQFEIAIPTLDEIFIRVVEGDQNSL
ncbi:ABC transporter ATP-binding protein [Chloroflexota bacterium]